MPGRSPKVAARSDLDFGLNWPGGNDGVSGIELGIAADLKAIQSQPGFKVAPPIAIAKATSSD